MEGRMPAPVTCWRQGCMPRPGRAFSAGHPLQGTLCRTPARPALKARAGSTAASAGAPRFGRQVKQACKGGGETARTIQVLMPIRAWRTQSRQCLAQARRTPAAGLSSPPMALSALGLISKLSCSLHLGSSQSLSRLAQSAGAAKGPLGPPGPAGPCLCTASWPRGVSVSVCSRLPCLQCIHLVSFL